MINLNFSPYFNLRDIKHFSNVFSFNELNPLIKYLKENQDFIYDDGYSDSEINLNKSKSINNRKTWEIPLNSNEGLIINFLVKLKDVVIEANSFYGFELDQFLHVCYFEYFAEKNKSSQLPWHMDMGLAHNSYRKLSFTLPVNEKKEFKGGDLKIFTDHNNIITPPFTSGSISLFPSFLPHMVTPVTKGTRKVIVGFVGGRPYR